MNWVKDPVLGKFKGHCFINFSSKSEAEEAINRFDKYKIQGRWIVVKKPDLQEKHKSPYYGYPSTLANRVYLQPFHNTIMKGQRYLQSQASNWIPLDQRQYDIIFMGNADAWNGHEGPVWLKHHRHLAINTMNKLSETHPRLKVLSSGKKLSYNSWIETLCNSKILVSPWGYGEWSGKDEESAWCGTLLIKPGGSWYDF